MSVLVQESHLSFFLHGNCGFIALARPNEAASVFGHDSRLFLFHVSRGERGYIVLA